MRREFDEYILDECFLILIVCAGLRPKFMVRMDCARVAVNLLIDFASMSWNPSPPRPGGVVTMYQACSGRGLFDCCVFLLFIIAWRKCLVMLLIVLVKVVE